MPRPRQSLRNRRGFTLIELLITMTMITVVGAAIIGVFNNQQRFSRAATDLGGMRTQLQTVTTLLPADLRNISASGNDILAMSDSSIHVRSTIVTSIVCGWTSATSFTIAPTGNLATTLGNGTASAIQLTSLTMDPVAGDSVFIWDEGATAASTDDVWWPGTNAAGITTPYAIAGVSPAGTCTHPVIAPSGLAAWTITLSGTTPLRGTAQIGAAVRVVRNMRYGLYRASLDGEWYLGYRDTPGTGPYLNVAGPLRSYSAAGPTGLRFRYFDANGVEIVDYTLVNQVARIDIMTAGRTTTASSLSGNLAGAKHHEDTLRVGVALRNRN